jgi:hypothetical protein
VQEAAIQQEFDAQFYNDDQIEAEAKVKRILEKRIEELNAQRVGLHAKIVAYRDADEADGSELTKIADEYRLLL